MNISYGKIDDTTLKNVMDRDGLKDNWKITKNDISVCKDCEFRYMCQARRAYIMDKKTIYPGCLNGIMTPMKLNGFRELLLFSLILLAESGCSRPKSYQKYNTFNSGVMIKYWNEKVNLGLNFYGDYKFHSGRDNKANYRELTDFYKEKQALLFFTSTTIPPFINCVGFTIAPRKTQIYLDKGFKQISDFVLSSEVKSDGETASINLVIRLQTCDVILSSFSDYKKNLRDITIKQDLDTLLKNEMLSIALSSSDSTISQNSFEIAEKAFNNLRLGNYLGAVNILKSNPTAAGDSVAFNFHHQALATYYSFIGDTDSVDVSLSAFQKKGDLSDSPFSNQENFLVYRGLDSLMESVKNETVIMVNESHFRSEHRYLVAEMLPKLKTLGFKYLAVEAVNESARKLNRRGFPVLSSGYYTREVNMANLIRLGISLGFTVVGYDNTGRSRELEQARTLYRKTLKNDPKSKLIVLTGHSHINERRKSEEKIWMASHFKALSSIDPLTINQEVLHYRPSRNGQLVTMKPITDKQYSNDLYIINGFRGSVSKFSDSTYHRVQIPSELWDRPEEFYLVRLYIRKEFEKVRNPVPICFFHGNMSHHIDLPNGDYIIRTENSRNVNLLLMTIKNGKSYVSSYRNDK